MNCFKTFRVLLPTIWLPPSFGNAENICFREEISGSAADFTRFHSEAKTFSLINHLDYGLASNITTGKRGETAIQVLTRVRGGKMAELKRLEIKIDLAKQSGGFAKLWQSGIRFTLIIGFLLAFFKSWTGWSAMSGHIPILLQMADAQERQTCDPSVVPHLMSHGTDGSEVHASNCSMQQLSNKLE